MRQLTHWQKYLLINLGVLALSVLLAAVFKLEEGYRFPEPLSTVDEGTTDLSDKAIATDETYYHRDGSGRTSFKDRQLLVDESFTCNLPLIVLDTNGTVPPPHVVWDDTAGYYVENGEEDLYVYGSASIIDNLSGINHPDDTPVLESGIMLRRRGNTSVNYDKHQYLLKWIDSSGKEAPKNVLGMGSDNEWALNISFIDKSLLRNYLAYTIAGEFMDFAPDTRFCEVIWRDGDTYLYDGVYLILENIKVGKNRVDLPAFSENADHLPFLLRRDRYDDNGTLLENYATKNRLLYGYLDILWPNSNILSDQSIQRITEQINQFEMALFAEDYSEFIQYKDCIDINSFVDYFILNEFLMNYDAGFNSTYIYSDYSGRLKMGPVWDFDQAMDNDPLNAAKLDSTAFHDAPWFRKLLRDPEFTLLILERYHELRQSILSDQSIQSFIDRTIQGLGSSIERDWARWGYFYRDGGYLLTESPNQPDRNAKTYEEEIEKLKTVLSTHGAWMDERLDSLYQFADPKAAEYQSELPKERNWGSILALVYVSIFFISITLVQRSEQTD